MNLAIQSDSISSWFQGQITEKTGSVITKETTPLELRNVISLIASQLEEAVANSSLVNENEGYLVNHIFSDGVYVREMHIPAGHMVLGKLHKTNHVHFISKGKVTVVTEFGGVEELEGPCTLVAKAGTKRLLFTHSDTIWSCVHVTDSKDVNQIEKDVIALDYKELDVYLAQKDYAKFLLEINFSQEDVEVLMESQPYTSVMPEGYDHLTIQDSPISGFGVFTSKAIYLGEVIGPSRIGTSRTPLGRYVNHSPNPNSEFLTLDNGDLVSVALQYIKDGEEITKDYRQGFKLWSSNLLTNNIKDLL